MAMLDLAMILDVLARQDVLLGVFLGGAGLVFMGVGNRVERTLTGISYGVLGFVICSLVAGGDAGRMVLATLGAMALGALSTQFTKQAMIVLSGAWAGYAAALMAGHFELAQEAQLGIAVVAFGVAVSLAFIMHREVSAFVLSFEGTLLVVAALVIFINQKPTLWSNMRNLLVNHPVFFPFVLLAGSITGFYWQVSELRQRDAGTSS